MSFGQLLLLLILGYLLYSAFKFFMLLYRATKTAKQMQEDYQKSHQSQSDFFRSSQGFKQGSSQNRSGEKDITRETKVIDERWLDEEEPRSKK